MLEENHLEFAQALWARRAIFTKVFLAINIMIFVVMELAGGTTNEATLLAFGVKSNDLINQGEIWRFVTPVFIHIGLLHLLFNSYALWMVGAQVEKLYGSARFILFYVLTGAAGVFGSYWVHPETISAGASGAIFGLFGVLLVFGYKYKGSIPPFFQRAVGAGVLPIILINLVIGFTIPAIDNSAHIGGLIAGALLAAVIPYERPGTSTPPIFKIVQAGLLLVVAASFYQVAAGYSGPGVSFRNLARGWGQLLGSKSSGGGFIDAINNAQRAFERSSDALSSTSPGDVQEVEAETAKSVDELKRIPRIGGEGDALSAGLLEVMQDQYALLQEVQRSGTVTFADHDRASENMRKYNELMKSFRDWVEKDGPRFGIQLRRP